MCVCFFFALRLCIGYSIGCIICIKVAIHIDRWEETRKVFSFGNRDGVQCSMLVVFVIQKTEEDKKKKQTQTQILCFNWSNLPAATKIENYGGVQCAVSIKHLTFENLESFMEMKLLPFFVVVIAFHITLFKTETKVAPSFWVYTCMILIGALIIHPYNFCHNMLFCAAKQHQKETKPFIPMELASWWNRKAKDLFRNINAKEEWFNNQ